MSRHLAISPSDGAFLLVNVQALVGGSVQENLSLSVVVVPDGTAAEQSAYLGSVAGDVPEVELQAGLLALEERRHPEVKAAADAQVVADAALATALAAVPPDQAAIDKATAGKVAADKAFADADAAAKAADAPTPPAVEPLDAAVAADKKQLAADEAAAAAEDAAEATPPVVPPGA